MTSKINNVEMIYFYVDYKDSNSQIQIHICKYIEWCQLRTGELVVVLRRYILFLKIYMKVYIKRS